MPSITLADIQAAADKKYGPLVIELPDGNVELTNPIRLSKDKRKALADLDAADADGEVDVDEKVAACIKLAAKPADAKRLLAALGGDLAQLKEVIEQWSASSQPGEASPSPS
jgi:tail assembly protein